MLQPQHFSNVELFKLLQDKDKNAFILIYDKYAPSLYGTILKIVKNDSLAAKILEKVFLSVWNGCKTLDYTNQSFFIWMYSITYKVAKEELINLALNKQTLPELIGIMHFTSIFYLFKNVVS